MPKAAYLWPPIDFVQLEMALGQVCRVFDFVAHPPRGAAWHSAAKRVKDWQPDLIIGLIGGFSAHSDALFLRSCLASDTKLICSGEASLDFQNLQSYFPWISGRLDRFPDYSSLLNESLPDWIYAEESVQTLVRSLAKDIKVELPVFPGNWQFSKAYRIPGLGTGFVSPLLNFGCPWSCSYCNSGQLGYKSDKSHQNIKVLEQQLALWKKQKRDKLYFRDFSLGPDKPALKSLCSSLQDQSCTWNSFIRPERIDQDTIPLLKAAGAARLQIGVESENPDLLNTLDRKENREHLSERLHSASKQGLQIGIHFALGLPGHRREDLERTIQYALTLNSAHAAFNIFVPRCGTPAFTQARSDGRIKADCFGFDSTSPTSDCPVYCAASITELQNVVRSAYKRYYLRFKYIPGLLRHDALLALQSLPALRSKQR